MQTFLPYPNFDQSAEVLDRLRLGKQRVENLQIMQTLFGYKIITKKEDYDLPRSDWYVMEIEDSAWAHHPAVLMWDGYEASLLAYQQAICDEWVSRGYTDTCLIKSIVLFHACTINGSSDGDPPWLGDREFHRSHQSNLIRKDPDHYEDFFPGVPYNLPYIWPSETYG